MRKTIFANNEYYHIYNRGVDKRVVFQNRKEFERYMICMDLLNDEKEGLMLQWRDFNRVHPRAKLLDFQELSSRKPLVEIVAYCLNPNHFHFILKQEVENGIIEFMHKLSTSYTNYFNKKNDRSGALFQGPFKSIHISSNEYLLYLSAYVNCNSEVHGISSSKNYQWCSFPEYIENSKGLAFGKEIVLGQFKDSKEYQTFAIRHAKSMKEKKENEKLLFE